MAAGEGDYIKSLSALDYPDKPKVSSKWLYIVCNSHRNPAQQVIPEPRHTNPFCRLRKPWR